MRQKCFVGFQFLQTDLIHAAQHEPRVVAALFSQEVTSTTAQDPGNFQSGDNKVVSAAIQPDGRVSFLALRDPLGPFVPESVSVSGVTNPTLISRPVSAAVVTVVPTGAAVVSGLAAVVPVAVVPVVAGAAVVVVVLLPQAASKPPSPAPIPNVAPASPATRRKSRRLSARPSRIV